MMYHRYFRNRKWGDGVLPRYWSQRCRLISNTLFFDKCLGWQGICAEPQTRYHAGIQSKRGCSLVPTCVLGQDAKVSTDKDGVMFTVKETTTDEDEGSTVNCVGIQTLQKQFGFETIDLVSLDIEGMEPSVLKCWPFDTIETRMFVVETDKHHLNTVDLFFHRNGYINADSYTHVANGKTFFLDNLYVKD